MSPSETYILFELAGAAYGISSHEVLHIDQLEHVTPVPNAAPWVDGVVFSRGQVIPAMNLRAHFGFPREAPTPRSRLIFVKSAQRTVALVVDSAREFRTIPATAIRPIAETLAGVHGNYIKSVASLEERLVLILDVPAVLNHGASEPEALTDAAPPAALQPAP